MAYLIHQDQPAGLPLANLDELNDTNISSPADKDVLSYDATSQKWINDSSINSAIAGIMNDDLEDYTTITDSTLGTITLHRYKNGMKFLFMSVPNLAITSYVTGYIVPQKYRSAFPNGCIVPASTWTNGIPRRVAIGNDGRIQVSTGQETGLYCVGVYI